MKKRLFILLITFIFVPIPQGKINFQIKAAPSSCADSPECTGLIIDESGVSVPANFVLKNNNPSMFLMNNEKGNIEVQRMQINLYTSITMLVFNCQAFIRYDCQRYSCEEHPNNTRSSLHPYFIATGFGIEANISLDDESWKLNKDAITILSTSCIAGVLDFYGAGTYGAIGSGIEDGSSKNFMGPYPIFSTYLYQDNSGGELWFSRNLNKAISTTPSAVLPGNNSWHVENIQAIGVGNKISQLNNTHLIFDLNTEEIVFPRRIFKTVMQAFTKGDIPIRCDDSTKVFYRPVCAYYGELKDLPNISLYIGDQEVVIPPWVYVLNPEAYDKTKGTLTLNLKGVHNSTHLPEIHVIEEYKNHTILGRSFMRYYYIVFDGADHLQNKTQIEFYVAGLYRPDKNFSSISYWIIIGLPVTVTLLIVAIIIRCLYVRWRKIHQASSLAADSRHSEGGQHPEPLAGIQNQEDTLNLTIGISSRIANNSNRRTPPRIANNNNSDRTSMDLNPFSVNDMERIGDLEEPLFQERGSN